MAQWSQLTDDPLRDNCLSQSLPFPSPPAPNPGSLNSRGVVTLTGLIFWDDGEALDSEDAFLREHTLHAQSSTIARRYRCFPFA